jgi:Permuted papain-like amidase enzyme, YaeF/YiiX, C92 family
MSNFRIWLQASSALLLTVAPVLAPVGHAHEPPIDVSRDAEARGKPDGLAAAVRQVEAARDRQLAIAQFANRLPYSARTRALQKDAERLQHELEKTTNRASSEAIVAQLRSVSDEMLQDPNYRSAMDGLDTLLPPNRVNTGTTGQRPLASADMQAVQSTASVSWGLWPGVVMLMHSQSSSKPAFLYARYYSHAGTYDRSGSVYEANPDGVRLKPLANWQVPGLDVALGYNRSADTAGVKRVADALQTAEARYGTDGHTPYNYIFPNKWTDSAQYCSQLVWKIQQGAGVDVDSNDWGYQLWIASRWGWWAVSAIAMPAVAPDEIAADGDIYFFWAGSTG